MNYMVRLLAIMLVSSCLTTLCGCQVPEEPAPEQPEVPVEGITIKDIQATDTAEMPDRVVFRVFTFEFADDQVDKLQAAFEGLDLRPIRFVNQDAFLGNDFAVGYGRTDDWQSASKVLAEIKAIRKETKNLVVYDGSGDDIAVGMLQSAQSVSFVGVDGKAVEAEFMPGRFSWTLRARPDAAFRGVAHVEMRPVYRFGLDSFISRLADYREITPLDGGGFGFKISSDDFILLAPTAAVKGPLTLSNILFVSPENDSALRVYMIGCVRVDN